MLWVGTRPSARAAPASRQPPTSTRPARSSAGAHDAQSTYGQQRMGCVALAVGGERARIVCRRPSRGGERSLVRALAEHVEQVAVGRLRPVPERAAEVVEQDDRPVLAERRGIAPEPHRVAEPGRRRGDRVRAARGARAASATAAGRRSCRAVRRAGSRGARRRAGAPRRARRRAVRRGQRRPSAPVPSCCSATFRSAPGQHVDEAAAAASARSTSSARGEEG